MFLWLVDCRFKATLYPCPDSSDERREMALGVLARLSDLETVSSNILAAIFCKSFCPKNCHALVLHVSGLEGV